MISEGIYEYFLSSKLGEDAARDGWKVSLFIPTCFSFLV